jgi:hypothetical protein
MTITRTSLTAYAASMREPDPAAARRIARDQFHATDGDWVIIHKDWLKGWAQRQQAVQLGELVHGKRSAK